MAEQEEYDYDTITLISIERDRQIQDKGYDSEHDDLHESGEIAMAAACYAAGSCGTAIFLLDDRMPVGIDIEDAWPWNENYDKRVRDESTDERRVAMPPTVEKRIRLLVKAGALIAAEIDRLRRASAGGP